MKKLIASLALVSTSVFAQHHHSPHIGGYGVWPLLIGGTIGYVIGKQNQPAPVYSPPPVYNNTPPVYNLPRTPQPIYERRTQYDFDCQCYREIYVQIGWQ